MSGFYAGYPSYTPPAKRVVIVGLLALTAILFAIFPSLVMAWAAFRCYTTDASSTPVVLRAFAAILVVNLVPILLVLSNYRTSSYMYELFEDFSWESAYLAKRLPELPGFPETGIALYSREPDGTAMECMRIERSGKVTLRKGYAWDGCTPKIAILNVVLVGTWDGAVVIQTPSGSIQKELLGRPAAYYASLVHDGFCQFMQELCDEYRFAPYDANRVFWEILRAVEFPQRDLYYRATDIFGPTHVKVVHEIYRKNRKEKQFIEEIAITEPTPLQPTVEAEVASLLTIGPKSL